MERHLGAPRRVTEIVGSGKSREEPNRATEQYFTFASHERIILNQTSLHAVFTISPLFSDSPLDDDVDVR